MRRVVISLVLLPVLLFALLLAAVRAMQLLPEPNLFNELAGAGPFFIFGTFFLMGCVAVPLLFLALWRRWLELWHMSAIGILTGLFAVALLLSHSLFDERLRLQYRLAMLGDGYPFLALGATGGILFWLLAFFRNPAFSINVKATASESRREA